jgi:hypothetical protein
MVVQIKITGLDRARKFIAKLPEEIEKEALLKSEQFMRDVMKSAKLRAPVDTGFLKSQLTIKKYGNTITLGTGDAFYAYFQEFGYRSHLIPFEYFEQHYSSPSTSGIFTSPISGFSYVKKSHPFIIPALEANLPKLPNMLMNGVNNAIIKSRR